MARATPCAGATRDDFAAAILAAMDALDVERAHICGLSLGGVVAIAMHAAAPERCASLILADSFAVPSRRPGIHERSVEASRAIGMRALAEARVGAAARQRRGDADLRDEVIETMARDRSRRLSASAPRRSGWPTSASAAPAIGVPTLVWSATRTGSRRRPCRRSWRR